MLINKLFLMRKIICELYPQEKTALLYYKFGELISTTEGGNVIKALIESYIS